MLILSVARQRFGTVAILSTALRFAWASDIAMPLRNQHRQSSARGAETGVRDA